MLRVTIEVIPFGEEAMKEKVGEITIVNDGKHEDKPQYGNYNVEVWDTKTEPTKYIVPHHFRDGGFWILLKRIISKHINQSGIDKYATLKEVLGE